MKGEAKKVVSFGSESLSTNRFHSHGKAGENGVAGDVCKADGKRTTGEGELAEAAEEEHRDHGTGVE